jgi:hypothetical protein
MPRDARWPHNAVPALRLAAALLALTALVTVPVRAQDAAARDTLAVDLTELLDGAGLDDLIDADTPRDRDGLRQHLYRYDARAGDVLHAELEADGPLALEFGVFEGDTFLPLETAEDADGVLVLDVAARADGPVYFRVVAEEDGGAHPYRLLFAGEHGDAADAAFAPCPALTAGGAHNGHLEQGATGTALNPALCALDVRAGQTVTLTLRSTDFDALVAVGRLAGGYFFPLDFNDDDETVPEDAETRTDARLVFTVPARAPRLYVLVHGGGLDGGAYRLDVTAGGTPTP